MRIRPLRSTFASSVFAAVSIIAVSCPIRLPADTTLIVGPVEETVRDSILEAEVPAPDAGAPRLSPAGGGAAVPCQVLGRAAGKARIAWLAADLEKRTTARWALSWTTGAAEPAPAVKIIREEDGKVRVEIDGAFFTRYVFGDKEFKPYLYPILLDGKSMTRHYPMEKGVEGERADHPHHRSFFFTHGDVNGVSFWEEAPGRGHIVHREFLRTDGGPVLGIVETRSDWIMPDGKKILDDRRTYRFIPLAGGARAIDLTVKLTATDGDVVFGDTKEGTFGIRVAGSLKESSGGRIVNSRGQVGEREAWGRPAEWVDYSGKIDGKPYGIAILDHPTSFRHPTHWHVRSYGLFAANPFGYHDFYHKKEKEGNYELAKGKSVSFSYRVIFHRGDTDEAHIAAIYRGFATPPAVRVVTD